MDFALKQEMERGGATSRATNLKAATESPAGGANTNMYRANHSTISYATTDAPSARITLLVLR